MMRVLAVLAFFCFLYLLGPILVIVGSALGDTKLPGISAARVTLIWFQAALAERVILSAFATSLGIAGAAMVLSLGLGLPAAFCTRALSLPRPARDRGGAADARLSCRRWCCRSRSRCCSAASASPPAACGWSLHTW